jgi:hypothetical protein
MNSDTPDASLAKTTNQREKYQPLVKTNKNVEDMDVLQPFFSTQGATPWGEVIEEAKTSTFLPTLVEPDEERSGKPMTSGSSKNQSNSELWSMLIHDERKVDDNDDSCLDVLTDKEITAKRQAEYERERILLEQYENDTKFVHEWVRSLTNPNGFKIQNVDAIMEKHFGQGF